MALITVAFLEDRIGIVSDSGQAQARIDDVSADVVDYVDVLEGSSDTTDTWDETSTPASVQAVVARVVERALQNPMGASQEGLGDHNWAFPTGAAGATLAPKDRKQIRRAVKMLGARSVDFESHLPLEPTRVVDGSELVL